MACRAAKLLDFIMRNLASMVVEPSTIKALLDSETVFHHFHASLVAKFNNNSLNHVITPHDYNVQDFKYWPSKLFISFSSLIIDFNLFHH